MTERSNKPWLTDQYRDYLLTDEWALVRATALARAGYRCVECAKTNALQVHHRHYRTLGHETPDDVIVLCEGCHETEHQVSDARRLYERRLNGWATKRWDEDWANYPGYEYAVECFDDWLRVREDRW